MKNIYLLLLLLSISSCAELDLNPLANASTENWYSSKKEYEISLADFYREYLWELDINWTLERMSDNWSQRQVVNSYASAGINSEWGVSSDFWRSTYKGISRANTIIKNLKENKANLTSQELVQFEAEARAFRAIFYGRLIFYYGDVPFYLDELAIDQAFNMGRTDSQMILQNVYRDFDYAIENLPVSYQGGRFDRITKGSALAFKARIALNLNDYQTAKTASEACMNLNQYSLHDDYQEYFLSKTKNSAETIFAIPRLASLNSTLKVKNFLPRTVGGSNVAQPSWDLFATYLCTDGKSIDKSELFDPKEPFNNRDPRLKATIAEFEEPFLGFIYDPRPASKKVLDISSGKMIKNKDTRSVDTYASYNGLSLKKGVDMDWIDDYLMDGDIVIMRYADVLLMYAEAKIELNELDSSVKNAMYLVRERAYNNSGLIAPEIHIESQEQIRRLLRMERRVELAWENRRVEDLIRWKLAEKALNRPIYGLLDPAALQSEVVDKGLWFWSDTPIIDTDGLPVFDHLLAKGTIKVLAQRAFDAQRQYLWPIPSKEIIINSNIIQNPGY
ncbi:RagB/SusD family nutrient uptake outer membrane protein [Myroides pelagicus]|uniref:RagB/SusD family nutrient uptake outer membrane protein n=1 Tax=Myroides pelagicus TaxID=270914 RepID=UPI002DC02CB4|nr:RagB/SusD family nutrient uptake outer membrane protein [Myroides pelagicus]MEC4115235.1 RagB/SusD family nutrient uptake outer membrane protein [Myroides pelagicus]